MRLDLTAAVLWKRRRLRSRERWSRAELDAHRARSLAVLVDFAVARSPYWKRVLGGRTDVPLSQIPPLTKATLMDGFDDVVTDRSLRRADVEAFLASGSEGLFHGRYWVSATSGSSGRRSIIPSSLGEWSTTIASYARANEWAGIHLRVTGRTTMAVVSSTTPSHQSARVGAAVKSSFLPTRRFDAGGLLDDTVRGLNEQQPEILVAYASMLRILADEQIAGRLVIHPRAVNCSSEPLTREARERTRAAWGVEPFDVYASTETAGIAAECEQHDGLHIFEDLVIPEVVDDDYRPVAPGATGSRLLVTVLSSRTLPLLRYELTDRIRTFASDAGCPCGRTLMRIAGIEGRTDDVLFMRGSAGDVAVHPVVFHTVLDPLPISAWQVRQEGDALHVLLARPHATIDAADLTRHIAADVARTGAIAPCIQLDVVDAVPPGAAGKRPRIVADRSRRPQGPYEVQHAG
ncbi:MAG: phenylacetate--CoA ligase family protein [Deltaproteobacteria bacterium]|nr:phenylacetate--CoA ligase family protein [Deltaproteobacteria bacterium]